MVWTINLLPCFALASTDESINKQPAPGWVNVTPAKYPENIPVDDVDRGVYYLLVDNQVRAMEGEKTEFYSHFSDVIVNQQGLEKSSQINLEYDPSYETLVLHSLNVIREGKAINKLDTAKVSIIQREEEMENLLYNGTLTANIILDDVRVGDIVDYSFTIRGSNPVYQGIFSYDRYLQWAVPVGYQSVRILWGKKKPLNVAVINSDEKIEERTFPGYREYSIAIRDRKPLVINSEAPEWYNPYITVFFNETESWSEVVNWALPLYEKAIESNPELLKVAQQIRSRSDDPEKQLVDALMFVQSEVRYLGIEMGANSHEPSPASETLQRRYGDCKDKAVLLVSLLDLLGIRSAPALVHTDNRTLLAKYPPGINSFDHVIVKAMVNNKPYWIDPTRLYQKGHLSNIFQPDFGYALVVEKNVVDLEAMGGNKDASYKIVHDKFDLTQGGGKDVIFESRTEYAGYHADRFRYQLAENGLSGLEKNHLDYFREFYDEVEAAGGLNINEDDESGKVVLNEKYLLRKFWESDDNAKGFNGDFYGYEIVPYTSRPKQVERNSPYKVVHPVDIAHRIEVSLKPGDWEFEDEKSSIDNPFFSFVYGVQFDKENSRLVIDYHYETKTNSVEVKDFEEFLKARNQVRDVLEYGIIEYFENAASTPSVENTETSVMDNESALYLLALVIYLAILVYVITSWRLEAKQRPVFESEKFYPVSLVKFLVLSVLTFGIYTAYWSYRNWRFIRERDGSSIMPVARGIFDILWYYPLFNQLENDSQKRFGANRVLLKPVAVLFAVLYFMAAFLDEVSYLLYPALVVTPLLVFPLVNYVNYINADDQQAYHYNSTWKLRHSALIILFSPIVLFSLAGDFNLLPSDKVVRGEDLWTHDIKFMQRKGVVKASEKIVLFYAGGIFSLREDGNGFTEESVFSYWKDDDTGFNIERSQLSEISKIDVEYATKAFDDTIITIVRDDGTNFLLYVSAEEGLDKTFVAELNKRWKNQRKKTVQPDSASVIRHKHKKIVDMQNINTKLCAIV